MTNLERAVIAAIDCDTKELGRMLTEFPGNGDATVDVNSRVLWRAALSSAIPKEAAELLIKHGADPKKALTQVASQNWNLVDSIAPSLGDLTNPKIFKEFTKTLRDTDNVKGSLWSARNMPNSKKPSPK